MNLHKPLTVIYRRMRKLVVDKSLFDVPTSSMGYMSLFTVSDVMFAIILPRIWWNSIRNVSRYQRNLSLDEWPSLATIYPRFVMWAYSYLLFLWAEYCDVNECLLNEPDRSVIAEAFLRYICEIDTYIDSFDSREILARNSSAPQSHPIVREVASELSNILRRLSISYDDRMTILRLIARYRRDALRVLASAGKQSHCSLESVLKDKEDVAGMLFGVWSSILSTMYDVPAEVSEQAKRLFINIEMVLQIHDDLKDVPEDYRVNAQNLAITIFQESSDEWQLLVEHLRTQSPKHLQWSWVRLNAPMSYRRLENVYRKYLWDISSDPRKPVLARKLAQTLELLHNWVLTSS